MTTPTGQRVVLVAAVAENGVIGLRGDIPWRVPGEQRHFKAVTTGHVLLMGRGTFDSIGRPLPGRTTVVVTRDPAWAHDGVVVAHSVEEALELAATYDGDVMVAGGAQVYAQTMGLADAQVLTRVPLAPEGDTFYPAYDAAQWRETRCDPHEGYTVHWLERLTPARS